MTTTTTSEIVYPETDGMPLPDGEYQSPIFRRVLVPLEGYFRDVRGAHVNGNTILYYVEGDPRRSVSPDCYVVFDLSEAAIHSLSLEGNNTYLLWEVGKPPEFVLEIASGSTARTDLGRKRELYAELGISEYWRYDASGGDFYGEPLVGEHLVDGEYRRMETHVEDDGRIWGHSDELNLDLWWIEGELRYRDPAQGRWLPTYEEQQVFLAAAEQRAEMEQARADAERIRADAAEARLAEMEVELRRLRNR